MRSDKSVSLISFMLKNNDGWHLWYIKVYIGILIVLPIIKAIVKEECSLSCFLILWSVFICLRFTVGLISGLVPIVSDLLLSFQIPFFHYHGYIGGTSAGNYPSEFVGLFMIMGYVIYRLETYKTFANQKKLLWGAIIMGGGLIATCLVTIVFCLKYATYIDWFSNPLEVHVILYAVGFLVFIYSLQNDWMYRYRLKLRHLSECTLGIYILHPLVRMLISNIIVLENSLVNSLILWILCLSITLFLVDIIKKMIPSSVSKWFL